MLRDSLWKGLVGCAVCTTLMASVFGVGVTPAWADRVWASADEAIAPQSYGGFPDVNKRDWYVESGDFDYVIDRGLMSGYSNGNFGPYDTVTRGQVMTILYRMAGEPDATSQPFDDVDYGQYYGPAIRWARAVGVASGYTGSNSFGPDNPVTREQLAVMLANYAEKVAAVRVTTDGAALNKIAGSKVVSDWAQRAMGWAVDMEIIGGIEIDNVDYIKPQDNAQRCQLAKMIAVLHRDVGVRWAGTHVMTFEKPEGTFSSRHNCMAGRDNPAIIEVTEIDPVTETIRCDVTGLLHAHRNPENVVDSCNGDVVTTVHDIQVEYWTAITPKTRTMYKGSKDNLLINNTTCIMNGTFYKDGGFRLQLQSMFYAPGASFATGGTDTYVVYL